MYVENIVVGKPIVSEQEMFALNYEDWIVNESDKTHYTDERFLPKILAECGIVKSVSEVLRNKPQFKINLNELDYLELKWGKRRIYILVGE